jgi:hypothetical protein
VAIKRGKPAITRERLIVTAVLAAIAAALALVVALMLWALFPPRVAVAAAGPVVLVTFAAVPAQAQYAASTFGSRHTKRRRRTGRGAGMIAVLVGLVCGSVTAAVVWAVADPGERLLWPSIAGGAVFTVGWAVAGGFFLDEDWRW